MLYGKVTYSGYSEHKEPKQITRDCVANTADCLNCQYWKPRYYIVQYRYQYRPYLRRYPGIRYTGIGGPTCQCQYQI